MLKFEVANNTHMEPSYRSDLELKFDVMMTALKITNFGTN